MTRKPEVLLIAVALVVFSVGCTWISVLSGPANLNRMRIQPNERGHE
jgi:hypothetical protein